MHGPLNVKFSPRVRTTQVNRITVIVWHFAAVRTPRPVTPRFFACLMKIYTARSTLMMIHRTAVALDLREWIVSRANCMNSVACVILFLSGWPWEAFSTSFEGAFRKHAKNDDLLLLVCPNLNSSVPNRRILMKFAIWVFVENLSGNLIFITVWQKNNRYFAWRQIHILNHISISGPTPLCWIQS